MSPDFIILKRINDEVNDDELYGLLICDKSHTVSGNAYVCNT